MKKQLALLVGGEFREFRSCYASWNELISLDHDLFFSTWSTSSEFNKGLGINIGEPVTEAIIKSVASHAVVSVIDKVNLESTNNLLYHWRNAFQLMYQSLHQYDTVMLIRPDLFLKTHHIEDYIKNILDDRIYGVSTVHQLPPPDIMYVNDSLFFGKTKNMVNAFMSIPYYGLEYKSIHYHLAKHFVNADIFVEQIPVSLFDYTIFRSSMRGYEGLNINELRDQSVKWWNIKHHINT
jgi:hypothetical protein